MLVIKNGRVRQALRMLIPFLLVPGCVAAGVYVFHEQRYAFISLCIVILSLVLFTAGFEKKRVGTRRLILTAIITALSVAGRFIPVIKPVSALTILTGMYLGGEAGFLNGALSVVISNFYFGQGPWTPFQMFATGLIGLCAGLLNAPLKRSRVLLTLFGALGGLAYSMIMDVWTVLWYNGAFSFRLYLAAQLTAVPYTLSYAISNVIFLNLFCKPFGEKLTRIRIKYGV